MTAPSTPCSKRPYPRHGTGRPRLVVLEGMPGAGKTTTAGLLRELGYQVVGEYTTESGDTVAKNDHPAVSDDNGHQRNWIRKTRQAAAVLARGVDVIADRDWLSSLAYAYSVADLHPTLLAHRTRWAVQALRRGDLLLADAYLVFDVDVRDSLRRRDGQLPATHPWSHPWPLCRLRTFYRHPPSALAPASRELAGLLREATWRHVPARATPIQQLGLLRRMVDQL